MVEQLNKAAAEIDILEYPENVRTRKEMYIRDKAHMVYEIVDNAVDEKTAGFCDVIAVEITDDYVKIEDNGRGIPVTPHKKFPKLSQAEVAYTVLHAGGKFGKAGGYATNTGGLHGVGASCVNALSSELALMIRTGGKEYGIGFSRGIKTEDLTVLRDLEPDEGTGTTVVYVPDDEQIWFGEETDYKAIVSRMKQVAYLNPGLTIFIKIETSDFQSEDLFSFDDGVQGYVKELIGKKPLLTDDISYLTTKEDKKETHIAFAYTSSHVSNVMSFVNNVPTPAGGDHLTGFNEAISRVVKEYAVEHNFIKDPKMITSDDTREGICGIVSLYIPQPKFEGQGKEKIKMPEARKFVREAVEEYFRDYLARDAKRAKAIIDTCLLSAKAREAARRARETALGTKDLKDSSGLPGKLTDCQSNKPEECEIYYVEGDSAAGTAKDARDRVTQAILPVFGKILNVEKKDMKDVINNSKLKEIIRSLRCGIGETFDLSKLRYHKIIIMSDADVDGYHIQVLYATFFYRYLPELIEKGYVYFAMPPLFLMSRGKEKKYIYTEADLAKEDTTGWAIQRFKGLGEMDADQLAETTMEKGKRHLMRLTVGDAESASAIFDLCMGEEVEPRRNLIFEKVIFGDSEVA